MDRNAARRLDLNAPLLSTRRPTGISLPADSQCGSCDPSDRVPFSWEQSPGKPKDAGRSDAEDDKLALPLPKPPPLRWHHPRYYQHHHGKDDGNDDDDDENEDEEEDDNEDNDTDEDEDDVFSDAIDLFSLCESLSIAEAEEGGSGLGGVKSGGDENGSSTSNFMLQRFLPAATALAASSTSSSSAALAASRNISFAGRACSSPKGCGLDFFFPWRAKHRLCAIKSPVKIGCSNVNAQVSSRHE
ncbi:hypothetical protein Ancab_032254 [Ancistrocladus abbreviatus]